MWLLQLLSEDWKVVVLRAKITGKGSSKMKLDDDHKLNLTNLVLCDFTARSAAENNQ